MLLDSARDLKQVLSETIIAPLTSAPVKSLALPAGPVAAVSPVQPSLAIGIAARGTNDFRIAVRCQRRELMGSKQVETIRKKARGEVDLRYVGAITKLATPWQQQRHRPLRIGSSVGHVKVTAGTLGCFVGKVGEEGTFILSNNHVLANENKAKAGDAVLQPGVADDGKDPEDKVAEFDGMVRLKKSEGNLVDAAIARVASGLEIDARTIRGLGKLAGLGPEVVDVGTDVAKLGRTTGLTRGRVTAFEMDNVVVDYDIGRVRFDQQIEIESAEDGPFSLGGDSGSLIVEADTRLAVALLFAGTDIGGSNDQGLTYANPIHAVFEALGVALLP